MKKFIGILTILLFSSSAFASYILIPMNTEQQNHLKAYGIAYWALTENVEVDWLLNYKGGSFAIKYIKAIQDECNIRGVSFDVIADAQYTAILNQIADPQKNMDIAKLEKAPKIAVYSPKSKAPWDDAVTLVLTYAEIPYDVIYDSEIMDDKLLLYDWLHLHHEDFTGQYGKFWSAYRNQAWYQEQVDELEGIAKKYGFSKVSQLKLAISKRIKDYVAGGGFMFAMCSATDSYDIALAAEGTDICDHMFDGDPPSPNAQNELDFDKTLAFENFQLRMSPYEYEYSNIDANFGRKVPKNLDYFTLFDFSAKWDPVPTMLTQNHTKVVKGFMGQTTAFNKNVIKSDILILGENKAANEAKYIHGTYGYGMWSWYGGHDPEDYQHFVGDPKTDLNLHPNSPGYRLILNNVLFPAAKKKERKT
ncbi:MAG: asparagine synthetase B [Bacteroidetes bacterium]|nr:asparagine synthetase B [Bacteroidota bacterium]MCB9227091.1 asparagine synthetase B [Chitinophagales bacterium]